MVNQEAMVGLVKMVSQVCLVHKESLVYKAKEEKRDQRCVPLVSLHFDMC
jgi:hypothetical protein